MSGATPGGPPRRRTALDAIPTNVEPKFQVLGTGVDRQAVQAGAQPMEMVVLQGFTREIEDAWQKSRLRPDEFWIKYPQYIEIARKLDEVLAHIQSRKK